MSDIGNPANKRGFFPAISLYLHSKMKSQMPAFRVAATILLLQISFNDFQNPENIFFEEKYMSLKYMKLRNNVSWEGNFFAF